VSLRLVFRKSTSTGKRKTAPGSYYIEGTDHTGKPVKSSLKTSNRDLAKRLFAEHVKATLEARASGPVEKMNFADAYELYKEREGVNSNTPHLDRMLPLIGEHKLVDFTQADLDKLARDLQPGCSPATLKRHVYTPFMAAYNACVDNEPPLAIPRKWKIPRVERRPADAPDDAYIAKLIAAVRHHERRGTRNQVVTGSRNEERDIAAVLFITLTGARTGEAQKLRLKDVDLAAGRAQLLERKNDEALTVAMPPMLLEAMRAHIAKMHAAHRELHGEGAPGDTLVFGFATRFGLPQMVARVRKRAGLPYYRPHAIGRHAFARRFLGEGRTLKELQEAGGWKTVTVPAEVYGHMEKSRVQEMVEKVDTKALHPDPKVVRTKNTR
jgi:integrase